MTIEKRKERKLFCFTHFFDFNYQRWTHFSPRIRIGSCRVSYGQEKDTEIENF